LPLIANGQLWQLVEVLLCGVNELVSRDQERSSEAGGETHPLKSLSGYREVGDEICQIKHPRLNINLNKNISIQTSYAVSPSKHRHAEHGVAEVGQNSDGPQQVDHFVGDHVNRHHRPGKTQKCENLESK
jgi:hypothetical protein